MKSYHIVTILQKLYVYDLSEIAIYMLDFVATWTEWDPRKEFIEDMKRLRAVASTGSLPEKKAVMAEKIILLCKGIKSRSKPWFC